MSSQVHKAHMGSFAAASSGWTSEFQRVMRVIAQPVNKWRQHRNAIRALSSMTDSQLKDIGLHRSEIVWAVRGRLLDR